jgi:hypothetical protein
VSGRWEERPAYDEEDEHEWWRPTENDGERETLPSGQLVSALEPDVEPGWAERQRGQPEHPVIVIERDPELDAFLEQFTPEALLEDSYDFGTLVELRYAGADGTPPSRSRSPSSTTPASWSRIPTAASSAGGG